MSNSSVEKVTFFCTSDHQTMKCWQKLRRPHSFVSVEVFVGLPKTGGILSTDNGDGNKLNFFSFLFFHQTPEKLPNNYGMLNSRIRNVCASVRAQWIHSISYAEGEKTFKEFTQNVCTDSAIAANLS